MTVKATVNVKPFLVPHYAILEGRVVNRHGGFEPAIKVHLSELDESALEELCSEFRNSVFTIAGKRDSYATEAEASSYLSEFKNWEEIQQEFCGAIRQAIVAQKTILKKYEM